MATPSKPPPILDENGVLVTPDSDLTPATPIRRQVARPWWVRPLGWVIVPKERT